MDEVIDGIFVRQYLLSRLLALPSHSIEKGIGILARDHTLGVSVEYGWFHEPGLTVLSRAPWLEEMRVSGFGASMNWSGLGELRNLKKLHIGNEPEAEPPDVSQLPSLEELTISWSAAQHRSLAKCSSLRTLWLGDFAPRDGSLKSLSTLGNLRSLTLFRPKLQTLDGIEQLSHLEHLWIRLGRKLQDVSAVRRSTCLAELLLEACKKLEHLGESLKGNASLKTLVLIGVPPLPSLMFLNDLPRLEQFRFFDTRIEDGDLSPCLRLKSTSFEDKRYLSHTRFEVQQQNLGIAPAKPKWQVMQKGAAKAPDATGPFGRFLDQLPTEEWREQMAAGDDSFTKEALDAAEAELRNFIKALESAGKDRRKQTAAFRRSVKSFDKLNERYSFIDTGERELLASFYDDVAEELDLECPEGDITERWREKW